MADQAMSIDGNNAPRLPMIIKNADDKNSQIAQLEKLLSHPKADAAIKKKIEQEIKNIRAGIKGESEAAYEMKVYLDESKNWMVINDLRITHGDIVAQIDHLLINRVLDFWVCESKNFSEGVSINESGEFTAFYNGKPYGIPSPIEQNQRHIRILERLLSSGTVNMPKRLGFNLKAEMHSLVLVSKGARISRPKKGYPGLDSIIKNDQLVTTMNRSGEESSALSLAKTISSETLEALAREIAGLHQPGTFDFAAKFGLQTNIDPINPVVKNANGVVPSAPPKETEVIKSSGATATANTSEATEGKAKQKLICHSCTAAIPYNVAKFCWFNKPKFGGNIFCVDCQKKL